MPDISIKTHDELVAPIEVLCGIATTGRCFPSSFYRHLVGTNLAAVRHLEDRGFTASEDDGVITVSDYAHSVTLRWVEDEEGNASYEVAGMKRLIL
jgi:hypothetical protein